MGCLQKIKEELSLMVLYSDDPQLLSPARGECSDGLSLLCPLLQVLS